MGKQTKSKRSENVIGKGKVTPVQVAFIVDRYLSDNNFVRTRSAFRSEASHLISKSPVNEAPKSLLSLGDMLDEYICLKEQKVILNQEKSRVDQEKLRVQKLLRGMQDAMNAYNVAGASASAPAPAPLRSPMVMPILPPMASPAANFPVYNTPAMMSTSRPSNSLSEPTNYSTPTTSQSTLKRRKTTKDVSGSLLASKRTRTQPSVTQLKSSGMTKSNLQQTSNNQEPSLQITPLPSTSEVCTPPVQGSSVAKCLFNPSSHSPGPQTPSPSPVDKSVSLEDNQTPPSSNKKPVATPQFTSTNRTVITSETIQVSPMKQVSYYSIERNHCISSPMKTTSKRFSTRDHVKGRLDFDGSDMAPVSSGMLTSDENTGSPSEDDAFDFDLPNLDCLGVDFNLTDLLGDFDFDGDRLDYFCQPATGSSPESLSGSPDTLTGGSIGDHELVSGMSSTVTEIRSEQDTGAEPSSMTSLKSITKCIKVFSPVKSRKATGTDQDPENS